MKTCHAFSDVMRKFRYSRFEPCLSSIINQTEETEGNSVLYPFNRSKNYFSRNNKVGEGSFEI